MPATARIHQAHDGRSGKLFRGSVGFIIGTLARLDFGSFEYFATTGPSIPFPSRLATFTLKFDDLTFLDEN